MQKSLKQLMLICFNSKMVRLKAAGTPMKSTYNEFQFQNGAIKRSTGDQPNRASRRSFNSKMVRLKVVCFYRAFSVSCCFNSKMVRLKVTKKTFYIGAITSFNSKMVRLKARSFLVLSKAFFCFNSKMVRLKEFYQ